MADTQQTVDPSKVDASLAGITLTQFAKGTYITIDYESDSFTDEVAVDGTVTRYLNRDERATIKFTLAQASPSNDALSSLAATDRASGNGAGALQIKDNGPGASSIASAPSAWVKKIPSKAFSTEASNVDWEIRCGQLKLTIGGTSRT